MPVEDRKLGLVFGGLLLILRVGSSTLTPLFLDSLNPSDTVLLNTSSSLVPLDPSIDSWHRIDPFICIWISMGFDSLMLGTIVLLSRACNPGSISRRETSFPKSVLLFSGSFQAVSALLFQFSTSGSRTSPYLFGVLGYFFVPVTFILRYLILRKRPTRTKLLCALVILLAEFVSLIPTMFPQLESEATRKEEGGASGVGRILWPMCLVVSGIPHAVWSIMLELSVKTRSRDKPNATRDQSKNIDATETADQNGGYIPSEESNSESRRIATDSDDPDCTKYDHPSERTALLNHTESDRNSEVHVRGSERSHTTEANVDIEEDIPDIRTLNMAYIMFWNFFGTFLTTIALFWVDLIPGFGLMPDIRVFGKQFIFNVRCIVGAEEECGAWQIFTAWGRMLFKTSSFVTSGLLLRYGDGANFYAILGALQQPLKFLTFTLFDEQPFRWHPHASLSTWLSIGSLAIMFPIVIIYTRSTEPSTGSPDATETSDVDQLHGRTENDAMHEDSPLIRNINQSEDIESSRDNANHIRFSINHSDNQDRDINRGQEYVVRRVVGQGYGSLDSAN